MFFGTFGKGHGKGKKRGSQGKAARRARTVSLNLERLEDRLQPSVSAFLLQTDHSLLEQATAGQTLLSPAGTILSISAVTDSTSHSDVFAVTADQHLWENNSTGWSLLSTGSFQQLSAATNSAGHAVVFAVLSDDSLWEYGSQFAGGWSELSPSGSILSVSATTDAAGNDVVFAVTASHQLWEHSPALGGDGWAMVSAGSFQSVSAGLDKSGAAVAYGILTDDSLWKYDPKSSSSPWQNLSPSGAILSAAAAGPDQVFAVTANGNLWQDTVASGWSLTSTGSFASISGARTASGGQVFAVLADNSWWTYGTSWSELSGTGALAGAAVTPAANLTAAITGLPSSGYIPKGTQLTLGSSVSGGVGADTYSWTVTLNGKTVATGTAASLSFMPSSTGTYEVALTVTDSARDTATAGGSVVADLPPTVSLGGPYSGQAGSAITLTASAVNPNSGEAAGFTYSWAFGDGTTDGGKSATDSHAYAAPGTYTATVTATDSVGETATATAIVNVAADLTAAITGLPSSGYSPAETKLSLGSSVSGGVGADSYSWTVTENGATVASGSGSTLAFTPSTTGTYQIALTVTDSAGDTASANGSIGAYTVTLDGPYSAQPGTPVKFTVTVTNLKTSGVTYSWAFGDGDSDNSGGTPTDSHAYASDGNYTVTVTVTDSAGDKDTATGSVYVNGGYITTPYLNIPDFGAKPTIVSVQSGAWSNPATWSLGRVPTTGDVVDVEPGDTVTYDVNSTVALNTVEVLSGGVLTFSTAVSTNLDVVNLVVLQGGELDVGTQANPVSPNVTATVVWVNQPLDTTLDPEQYGNGLIVLGTMNAYGAVKVPYVTLAQEAHAGDTVLHLASPATGWQVGDKLQLPDTRQLDSSNNESNYTPQWEAMTIQSVSADGLTVTLTAPLQFDHLGGYKANGALEYLPQVVDMTRNVSIHSQSATGTRGYALFTDRADVNINYTSFTGMGRTTDAAIDDTTFDSNGNVTHVGANEENRNPITFLDLIGPTSPQADGYQFTFNGNVVTCPLTPMPFIWGVNVVNSYYGLIQNNDVVNWNGSGVHVDGLSSYNSFNGNFVMRINGTGQRGGGDLGLAGDGFWFGNSNNYVTGDIVSDLATAANGPYGYAYEFYAIAGSGGSGLGYVNIAAYQGADPSQPGQSRSVDMNNVPLLDFANDEAYGAAPIGLSFWYVNYDPFNNVAALASGGVVKNFAAWNLWEVGIYGYQASNITVDGYVDLGSAAELAAGNGGDGFAFQDYFEAGMVIENADIEDQGTGIDAPVNCEGTFTVENSYLADQVGINFDALWSVSYEANYVPPRYAVIDDVQFVAPLAGQPFTAINMNWYTQNTIANGVAPVTQTDQVLVYNYNGVSGDDFQVFYTQQAQNSIVPETVLNSDGTYRIMGAPVAGLTNAQAWAQYGLAVAGEVAPSDAATMNNIDGLVAPI